jgi:ATP-binding cassette subfamily F protein 3
LIKTLSGEHELLEGNMHFHPDCKVAYFAQHQLEQLINEQSPIQHLETLAPKKTESELRDFLGGFGFSGDRATSPVAPFSGGEKARLVLAMLVLQRPNLLLLDEPTNHLDLEMRHALTVALQSFEGACVVISHDRHLLRTVCDELYTVYDGQFDVFDGDMDDYPKWLLEQEQSVITGTQPNADKGNKKQQRQQEALLRQQLKPFKDAINKAEKQIEKLQQQIKSIDEKLADETLYTDNQRKTELRELTQQQGYFKAALEENELLWLEATDAFEQQKTTLENEQT